MKKFLLILSSTNRLVLKSNATFQTQMAIARDIESFRNVVNRIAEKYKPIHEGLIVWDGETQSDDYVPDYNLKIPPWLCQPYYRKSPEQRAREKEAEAEKMEENSKCEVKLKKKKEYYDREGNVVSKKHLKKLKRLEHTTRIKRDRRDVVCQADKCTNSRGQKCLHKLCKVCCKKKCFHEKIACVGHSIKLAGEENEENNLGQQMIEVE